LEGEIVLISCVYRQASEIKTDLPPSKGIATTATDMDSTESGLHESNVTESVTSSSSTLIPTVPPPTPYERRNTFRIGPLEINLFWAKVFFAFVVTAGQTGLDYSLPLWNNSTAEAGSKHSFRSVSSYFVLSFKSLSLVVIFGLGILFIRICSPRDLGAVERSYPHVLLFLVGLCDALHGVLKTVLLTESKPDDPPVHLQSILGNLTILLTISARRLFLRKRPTLKKLLCAVVVTFTPFFYFINTQNKSSGWTVPLIVAIDCLPAAMAIVLEERGVKMQDELLGRGINLLYFLFWISTYQFLCVASAFVWVDIQPASGNKNTTQGTSNIEDFGRNWWHELHLLFGAVEPAMIGALYIFLYLCIYVGSTTLLRYSEGATWLAIVQSLVTPLRCLIQLIFTWNQKNFIVATVVLLVMFFACLIYNKGAPEISLKEERRRREES